MLLAELAVRPGHVKQRHVLMDAAYPDNMDVDDRTIDSHIKRIRKNSDVMITNLMKLKHYMVQAIA